MAPGEFSYALMESRSGQRVPAIVDSRGGLHPLHSLVDPLREGTRLAATLEGGGFLVFLGLGGGFAVKAVLEKKDTGKIIIIEHNGKALRELLAQLDYAPILGESRVKLLIDPEPEAIEALLLREYNPLLYGALRVLPLRTRVEFDRDAFAASAGALNRAVEKISADFSVQSLFGLRWFSNILRNLCQYRGGEIPRPSRVAITAAGPSLDRQLEGLKKERDSVFVLATDASLPALLGAAIVPDGVLSIDCQHTGYHHFMAGLPKDVCLFLDLAGPPAAASLSEKTVFCSGGHPLARYIAGYWKALPLLDTSGGNVGSAALSLAHTLGASEAILYGADFSYPEGKTYAGETWLYPYFRSRETRLCPLEGHFSGLIYRSRELKKIKTGGSWYYETPQLRSYREHCRDLGSRLPLKVRAIPGGGAPLDFSPSETASGSSGAPAGGMAQNAAGGGKNAGDFLLAYRDGIAALPEFSGPPGLYLESLSLEERNIFMTLLPLGAALLKRRREPGAGALFAVLREHCINEINKILTGQGFFKT